jgi:site-specific DNA-methyltransferase (adenine-specific)
MLTKKQTLVLEYIKKYIAKHQYAPSLEEIKKHFRLASVSTPYSYIEKLVEQGYLIKDDAHPRGIAVVDNPPGTLATIFDTPVLIVEPKNYTRHKNLPLNRIILNDALKELKKLPSESCDIIIIDPPYNIGKDFGNNSDKRELGEYVAWSKLWIDEATRVLKPTGTMFIYGFSEILAYLSVQIPINKRWIIWHYTNKNVASLNFWQRSHEAIICAWKTDPIFNRDAVREPYTEGFLLGAAGKVRKNTVGRYSSGNKETIYNAHEGGALPRDVIKSPALAGGAGMNERWFLCRTCGGVFEPRKLKNHEGHNIIKHPTQKPLEISKKLIKSAMPEKGGVVLVPFVGTGSECVSAKALGVDYIGFEINPDYVKIAEKFLASVKFGQGLF